MKKHILDTVRTAFNEEVSSCAYDSIWGPTSEMEGTPNFLSRLNDDLGEIPIKDTIITKVKELMDEELSTSVYETCFGVHSELDGVTVFFRRLGEELDGMLNPEGLHFHGSPVTKTRQFPQSGNDDKR